jgi:hypothetical protein
MTPHVSQLEVLRSRGSQVPRFGRGGTGRFQGLDGPDSTPNSQPPTANIQQKKAGRREPARRVESGLGSSGGQDRMTGSTGWNRGSPTIRSKDGTASLRNEPHRHLVHPVIPSNRSSQVRIRLPPFVCQPPGRTRRFVIADWGFGFVSRFGLPVSCLPSAWRRGYPDRAGP